jgi:hypothetical protein
MLDNSAVSGNSLNTVGVGLDKEILNTGGLGKEGLGVEGGSGSLGGGEGMVPISEGVGLARDYSSCSSLTGSCTAQQ